MAENEKQLKFTAIYDSKGADKVQKAADELRKVYEQLGRSLKDVQKTLSDLDNIQKRNTDSMNKESDAIKNNIEQLRSLRQAHLGVAQATGGYAGMGYRTSMPGAGYGPSKGSLSYGAMPDSQRGFSAGVNTSPYQNNFGAWKAAPWMAAAKGLGMVGAGIGMAGGMVDAAGGWMQRSGHAEAHEKTMGLENLARAQSYRNFIFNESRSAPMAYGAYKAGFNFNVKTKNSGMSSVDPVTGQIIDGGGASSLTGGQLADRAQNMRGEYREHMGKIVSGVGQGISGVGKAVGAGGVIAGGIAGAMYGASVGSIVPGAGTAVGGAIGAVGGALAGGGVGMLVSAVKEVTQSIWNVHHEQKKLREDDLQAKASEVSTNTEHMKDEILAVTRHQMAAYNSFASSNVSFSRATGGMDLRGLPTDFDEGEAAGTMMGARRSYGRAFGGKGNQGAMFNAMRGGMSGESAANVIGTFQQAGSNGGEMLGRLWAMAVKNGMEALDMGFFEKMAGAVAKGQYSGAGGLRDPKSAAAMFAGMHRPTSFDIQERMGGMKTATSLFTDNNYFRSRGTVQAARILGTGAQGAEVDALAGASFEDLIGKGSEKLRAMGITPAQIKQMRDARTNSLGDVLGGYKNVRALTKGQDFSTYLRDLSGRMRNGKTRGAAKQELNTIAAYGSSLTGEEFGNFRGMIGAAGFKEDDLASAGVAHFKNVTGAGGAVVSEGNIRRRKDVTAGQRGSQDFHSGVQAIRNPKFQEYIRQEDPALADELANAMGAPGDEWKKTVGKRAEKINNLYGRMQGDKAAGTEPGSNSTQELNEAMGVTTQYMGKFGAELSNLVDVLVQKTRELERAH